MCRHNTHREFESVHDAHCCSDHGCKYGEDNCPVKNGAEGGISCDLCEENRDEIEAVDFLKQHSLWLNDTWSLTPEGRRYKEQFDKAVSVLEKHFST